MRADDSSAAAPDDADEVLYRWTIRVNPVNMLRRMEAETRATDDDITSGEVWPEGGDDGP